MFRLPKGKLLYEDIRISGLNLPDITTKLSATKLCGYAHFVFSSSYTIMVFDSGKLISLISKAAGENHPKTGFDAMYDLAQQMISCEPGVLNVCQLSMDLTMCIHALLQGEVLHRGLELALMDIKVLLARIKNNRINGCMRIYTDDRLAMIFYKDGNPLGFFNDGSETIESTPGDSQHIAKLPGAKLDLFTTVGSNELITNNLLDVINVAQVWETTQNSHKAAIDKLSNEQKSRKRMIQGERLRTLEERITAICTEYLGAMGTKIIEVELQSAGGNACLGTLDEATSVITALERGARLLMVSQPRINKMKELISNAIEQVGIVV